MVESRHDNAMATTMLLYDEERFRRVIGHEHMPALVEAVRNLDKKEAVA